jgi:hypothetical protein
MYELTACGLAINAEKCSLAGSPRIIFLGVEIDAPQRLFRLPVRRMKRLTAQIAELREASTRAVN